MEGPLRDEFHSINNLLHKITTQAGMARYHLEEKGIDLEKIEEEKKRLIKILDSMEENAMNVGEILKNCAKALKPGELRNE